MTPHVCRDGFGGAVVESMVGAIRTWTCAVCGDTGSDTPCAIGKCPTPATGVCRACPRATCDRHRSKRGRLCDACQRKTAAVVRGPKPSRFGRWGRTGSLHQ